jgi:hypothetical protein
MESSFIQEKIASLKVRIAEKLEECKIASRAAGKIEDEKSLNFIRLMNVKSKHDKELSQLEQELNNLQIVSRKKI